MLIIGEKINGTRSQVAKAIAEREKEYIQDLALKQANAGAARILRFIQKNIEPAQRTKYD